MRRIPDPKFEKLMAQLTEQDVTDLFGVVDTVSGAGEGDGRWTLLLSLFAWKVPERPLELRQLVVLKSVSQEELRAVQAQFNAYDVVRLKARLAEENVFGKPRALLVEILGKHTSDDELNRCAEKLQAPVTFKSQRFGTFTLDRRLNWFEAQTDWGGTAAKLSLQMEDDSRNPEATLAHVAKLWDSQADWNRRVLDCAVAKLLNIKNESWLDEEETELSADQFKARMKLDSITVYPDGTFEFWWDDGDLFLGHMITVSGDMTHGPKYASISG